ncbi:MAG: O-antigen ligase family protein [Verrucomicrobiota bacterium]|nr:O-antigen ligase family protein [Verrucomicrobiota bacterium]
MHINSLGSITKANRYSVLSFSIAAFILLSSLPKYVPRGHDSGLFVYKTVGALILVFTLLIIGVRKKISGFSTLTLFGYSVFCLFSTFWSINPIYSLASSISFICCLLVLYDNAVEYVDRNCSTNILYVLTALILYVASFKALIDYGIGPGRFVGNISPNHFAGTLIAAFGLVYLFSQSKALIIFSWVLSVGVSLHLESRGSLVQLVFIVIVYWASTGKNLKVFCTTLFFASLACVIVIINSEYILLNVLDILDKDRGISSGGTGRLNSIFEASKYIQKSPLIGYGYESVDMGVVPNSHNFFFNVTLELGFFGLIIVGMFIGSLLWQTLPHVSKNAKFFSFSLGMLIQVLFEVHLFNYGYPLSLVGILSTFCLLCCVRYQKRCDL